MRAGLSFKRKVLGIFLLWTLVCGLGTLSYAQIPHLINYQGRLTDKEGKPVADGAYQITFRIYDAQAAGNLLWEETHSSVLIQKGIFSILLGSVTNLNLAFDKPYYLEIQVATDEPLQPRQLITSAGYAIRAEKAEEANNAATVNNVGVSTTPVSNKILPLDNNAKLLTSVLKVYDSGWFEIASNRPYTQTHNLGTTKVLINIYISDTKDNSGYVVPAMGEQCWDGYHKQAGVRALTPTTITIRTGSLYFGRFADKDGNNVEPTSGYARIIMLALE